jgi:hypothetical protein
LLSPFLINEKDCSGIGVEMSHQSYLKFLVFWVIYYKFIIITTIFQYITGKMIMIVN